MSNRLTGRIVLRDIILLVLSLFIRTSIVILLGHCTILSNITLLRLCTILRNIWLFYALTQVFNDINISTFIVFNSFSSVFFYKSGRTF